MTKRPGASDRLGLVAMLYGYRALASLVIALPVATLMGGATASYPRAQGELFDPGALMLVESLRFVRRGIVAVGWSAGTVAVLALLGSVIPLGVLLAGLATDERLSAGALVERASKHMLTLALVVTLGAVAQIVALAITVVLGGKIVGAFALAPPPDDLAFVGVMVVALGLAAVLGVVRDMAAVAAVRGDLRLYAAVSSALASFRRRAASAIGAWAWRSALGVVGLVVAAVVAPPIARGGWLATVVAALLHQCAIAGATFAHVSWLAAAMRLEDGTTARSE